MCICDEIRVTSSFSSSLLLFVCVCEVCPEARTIYMYVNFILILSQQWNKIHYQARTAMENREKELDKAAEMIEMVNH